jgi:hypothetical protein
MIVRVRTNVGMWRVGPIPDKLSTVATVLKAIQTTRPVLVYQTPLCSDPACTVPLNTVKTLVSQSITHGSILYCQVDPATALDTSAPASESTERDDEGPPQNSSTAAPPRPPTHMKRVIGKDGSIQLVPSNEAAPEKNDRGFRKGLMPLRDIKVGSAASILLASGLTNGELLTFFDFPF